MQKEKNYGWALDSARKNPYNSRVAHPGVAQLVARMVRDHEAVGSNPATRTNEKYRNLLIYGKFRCFLFFGIATDGQFPTDF